MSGKRLYLSNLPYSLSREELENMLKGKFSAVGDVTNVYVPWDFEKSRIKGIGFVTFADSSHASEAIRMFNQANVGGRSITISYARDDKPARYATKREMSDSGSETAERITKSSRKNVSAQLQMGHSEGHVHDTQSSARFEQAGPSERRVHTRFDEDTDRVHTGPGRGAEAMSGNVSGGPTVTQRAVSTRMNTNPIEFDPYNPHVDRPRLVSELHNSLITNRFTLISSPSGTGKTSLVLLYRKEYPEVAFVEVDFNNSRDDPYEILLINAGIDLPLKKLSGDSPICDHLTSGKNIVVFIEDAQQKYDCVGFWQHFVKGVRFLPPNVRFVLCATRSLSISSPSPVDLAHFKFPHSLLFSKEEALELINLPPPTGLLLDLKTANVQNILIEECGGMVGLLRMSINSLCLRFKYHGGPSEAEVLKYYFSHEVTYQFNRCFSEIPTESA